MKKREYARPVLQVFQLAISDICGIGTGSTGTDEGGLAKKNDFAIWDEEQETTQETPSNNLWK